MKQWPLVLLWPDVFGAGKRQGNPDGWWHRLSNLCRTRGEDAPATSGTAVPCPYQSPDSGAAPLALQRRRRLESLRHHSRALTVGVFVLAFGMALLAGEPAKNQKAQAPEPIHVWADHIRYMAEENIARITGNVTIIKGDMRIDADSVRATLDPKTNRFDRITATGNVRVYTVVPLAERPVARPPVQLAPDGRKAVCEIAVYEPAKGIAVLYGARGKRPTVWVGTDRIQADVITFDRNKKTLLFEGDVVLSATLQPAAATPKKKSGR